MHLVSRNYHLTLSFLSLSFCQFPHSFIPREHLFLLSFMKWVCIMMQTVLLYPSFCFFSGILARGSEESRGFAISTCASYPQNEKQIQFHRKAVSLSQVDQDGARQPWQHPLIPKTKRRSPAVFGFSVFLCSLYLRLAFYVSYYYCAFRRAEENDPLIFYVCSMCINKNINLYVLK